MKLLLLFLTLFLFGCSQKVRVMSDDVSATSAMESFNESNVFSDVNPHEATRVEQTFYIDEPLAEARPPLIVSHTSHSSRPPKKNKVKPTVVEDEPILIDGVNINDLEASASGPMYNEEENYTEDFNKQLKDSKFAFTIDNKVNIEEKVKAEFVVQYNNVQEEIAKELIEELGIVITDTVAVSKIVIVDLVSDDFEINNITPTRQILKPNKPTRFLWELTPKDSGVFKVHLTVSSEVTIDGSKETTFIKSYDKEIEIEVTTKQVIESFVLENWEWVFSTLLVPLFFLLRDKFFPKKEDDIIT